MRSHPASERTPHPDPRTEAELQRIINMRRLAERKQAALDDLYENIRRLRVKARRWSSWTTGTDARENADGLQSRDAPRMEADILDLQKEISKATESLSNTDLSYL